MNQSQLVVTSIINFIKDKGVNFVEGETIARDHIQKGDKDLIAEMCVVGMQEHNIQVRSNKYSSKADFIKHFKQYIGDRLLKDSRLNGGVKNSDRQVEKKGPRDPQLKALRTLLAKCTSDEDRAEVQSHIDRRLLEIQPKKQEVTIDLDALPAELRHLAE